MKEWAVQKIKLLPLAIVIATFSTAVVALANYLREGISAFSSGPWLYIGFFGFIIFIVIVGTLIMSRFGGR